jgi:hypothetical protein
MFRFLIGILTFVCCAYTALLAEESTQGNKTPLAVKQRQVERMVENLERKFKELALKLHETEKERAERISQTLDESKNLLVHQRISELVKLLDDSQLDSAVSGQQQVLGDLRKLLALLLNEQNEREKAREEYERLDAWKKEIQNLMQEERPQKAESERLANKDQTLANLAAQIKAVEALFKQQTDVNLATGEARAQGVPALERSANKQAEVRQQTEKTADLVAGKSTKPTLGDGQSKEGKPNENAPSDGKPTAGKPTAGKPTDGKPSESGSAESSAKPTAPQPPAPGESSLREAAKNQQNAEKNLSSGRGKAGQEDQERALTDLKKALAELQREKNRIASLPPEEFKKLADKQSDTAKKTGDLQQQMQQQAQASEKSEQGSSGGSGSKSQPGQKSLQQAQKSMQDASGDLDKQDPKEAARNQDKALKDLEKALQEIEERLAQLREETQLEKLARLEARFREMLLRHQAAMKTTIEVEGKRLKLDELKKEDPLVARKWAGEVSAIATEERAIGLAAEQAYLIIFEDGTSVVFPEIVSQLRNDLNAVSNLLDAKKTEAYTQSLQVEVETTLKELIEALQKAQQQKEGSGGGGGGGGGGEEPLLPNSAELKLLRFSQLRINRRTESFDKHRAAELDDSLKQEVQNIAQRQAEIAEMTIRILERIEQ